MEKTLFRTWEHYHQVLQQLPELNRLQMENKGRWDIKMSAIKASVHTDWHDSTAKVANVHRKVQVMGLLYSLTLHGQQVSKSALVIFDG